MRAGKNCCNDEKMKLTNIINKRLRYKKSDSRLHFEENYRNRLKCKRSFDIPFSWLFAIIAGTIILLIAVYAASRIASTATTLKESEAAKDLANVLNPVTNGITSAFATKIDLKKETRVYLSCQTASAKSTYFGRQIISFSEKSGFLKKWPNPGANISRYNKYIFADNMEQGKTIYLFSKPFNTGFRVDDLIFMNLNKYCFVAASSEISEEIASLSIKNINLTSSLDLCSKNDIKVCFGFTEARCNVSVYGECAEALCTSQYETGYVEKNGKKLAYFDALIYAAIFSSPENYMCNIARLGKKVTEIANLHKEKAEIIRVKNCDTNLGVFLDNIIAVSSNLSVGKLDSLHDYSKQMNEENCKANCRLYPASECS